MTRTLLEKCEIPISSEEKTLRRCLIGSYLNLAA